MNSEVEAQCLSAPVACGLSVRVLRTVAELEEIRRVWESWPGNRDSDIDSYLTFLRSSPQVLRPHVIAVYRGGEPEAILVGRVDRGQIDFRLGYVHFKPKADVLYFVYGALRGNPSIENSELLIKEICESLDRREAHAAYLNFLRTDSHIYGLARKIPRLLSRDYISAGQPHFSASIPASVEEFYRGLSPKVRSETRRKQRKLLKDFSGAVKIASFRKVTEVDNLVRDAEEVAKKSYQRGLGVGFVNSPEVRERLRLKAQKGWLRAYVLYVAGRPCAYWICDLNQGILGGNHVGFDPELAKYSPGMYLMMKVIEGFCNAGNGEVVSVDFATGHAEYKQELGNREWQEAPVYIFAPSLKGVELSLIRFLTAGIDLVAKKVLGRIKLLRHIKGAWRRHATPQNG